ncbi:hypothetical protein SUDANB6_02064 [Streptomyces sp. enrichment culture]
MPGHGIHPRPGCVGTADRVTAFSGPRSDHRWSRVAEWTAGHPPERFRHPVHGVLRHHPGEALHIARRRGATTVRFAGRADRGTRADGSEDVDGHAEHTGHAGHAAPWETVPGYWDDIVSRIGTGVSE